MNESELEMHLKNLKMLILPSKEDLLKIINAASTFLEKEENLIYIEGNSLVIGDLHGHFFDFLNMLNLMDLSKNLIFLGDYVDRGLNSVELLIYLLIMKVLNSDKVMLIRGNHENRIQTTVYGFQEECISKYDHFIYWKFCEIFELFPIAAIVNKTYFLVHGGIKPDLKLEWIVNSDRVQEFSELSSLFWGDPTDEIDGFTESQRGAGYLYGRKAVNEFLKEINCKYLIRSHQLVFQGIEEKFDGKCITVWSAPNYCYKCKNIAAFVEISLDCHEYVYFKAVENQKMQQSQLSEYFNKSQ